MNKQEAIAAMEAGQKLTQTYFTSEEWVKQVHNMYIFEDGCQCTPEEFWEYRVGNDWNKGWSEYEE